MNVVQEWVCGLSMMQQTVLLSAIRGCDGISKFHKCKPIAKWYRRCILQSAFDRRVLTDPLAPGGGSFTGPIASSVGIAEDRIYDFRCSMLQQIADNFLDSRDELPLHYVTHFMHACEVLGYKHPDEAIREYWLEVYERLAKAFHLWPETEEQMDKRLGDNFEGWSARNDRSSSCSD